MNLKRMAVVWSIILLLNGIAMAAESSGIVDALNNVCAQFKQIVPVVAMLMFLVAGAIYAAGQIMGAETRARANVWSTAMLVGGIIGLILAASAQFFVETFAEFALTGTSTLDAIETETMCQATE